jgi:hypothetical protein
MDNDYLVDKELYTQKPSRYMIPIKPSRLQRTTNYINTIGMIDKYDCFEKIKKSLSMSSFEDGECCRIQIYKSPLKDLEQLIIDLENKISELKENEMKYFINCGILNKKYLSVKTATFKLKEKGTDYLDDYLQFVEQIFGG